MEKLYSEKVLDHFHNPRNMGELDNPDGVARVGNPVCGDVMEMQLKIATRKNKQTSEEEEYIDDIRFRTLGCGAAIATSSIVTEMVKGKTLKEAAQITNEAVAESLGGLPPVKKHCSVLAADAVKKAIADYKASS